LWLIITKIFMMENTTAVVPKAFDWKSWALLLTLAVAWGGSFIFMKRGLTLFHFTEIAAIRLALSAILLLPVLVVRWREVPHTHWLPAIAVSITGSTIPALLFPLAQTHINSSLAGILNSTTPLWVMVLGALLFGVSLTKTRVGGILMGLAGAATLILFKAGGHTAAENTNNLYGLFIILATALYGTSSNIIGRYMKGVNPLVGTSMGLVTVGIPALLYLIFFTNTPNMMNEMPVGVAMQSDFPPFYYLIALALLNTVLGSIGYITLIQRTSPVFASVVTYIMPIFSIAFGVLDGESITFIQIMGMGLILSGVYLVNKG
jgi:drug/metabolite transporter (DMT)-like permease